MKMIEETAAELALFYDYSYIVERYSVSLGQLIIAAYPIEESPNAQNPKYITFGTVKYMQMPTFWTKAPLMLETSSNCLTFLNQIGIEVIHSVPKLFYAKLPKSYVYVVCHSVIISDTPTVL